MSLRTRYTYAAAAVVTGLAGLALATPAAATVEPAPPPASEDITRHHQHGGSLMQTPSGTSATGEDSPWAEIGVAVIGGVALAGVGIAAGSAVRRRSVADTA